MITLSLDEFGHFEVPGHDGDAVFIGGILYDDKGNPEDAKEERKRIRAYYEAVIRDARKKMGNNEIKYPMSLHAPKKTNSVTKQIEYTVKTIIDNSLGEFLSTGLYKGSEPKIQNVEINPRRGKYIVYLLLKSDTGKADRVSPDAGFLIKDDYASNLYFHMATEVLQRTIFHNPLLDKHASFSLEIATRVSATLDKKSEASGQYEKLGYQPTTWTASRGEVKTKDNQPGQFFALGNADIYRTVLEQCITDDNPNGIAINKFDTVSINYENGKLKQEFSYMADSICSYFSYELNKNGRKTADAWLEEIDKRAKRLLPDDQLLIFAYDSVDVEFSNALRHYQAGDYYKALSILYDISKKGGTFYKYYDKTWSAFIKREIENSEDTDSFCRAVDALHSSQLSNRYEQERGLYIIESIEKMIPKMTELITQPEEESVFYRFFEAAMSARCHIGDSANAEAYYYKAKKYAHRVSTEDYLRTRNILTVCYCDSFERDKALAIAKDNVDYAKILRDVKKKIAAQSSSDGYLALAKAYSQYGQVLALFNNSEAEKYFFSSLNLYEERSADYYITLSYLLHHYLNIQDKDKYEEWAKEYFVDTDLKKQYEYIVSLSKESRPIIYSKYALFIYVKALYVFYRSEISDELWNEIVNMDSTLESRLGVHPTGIIYKYLALIAWDRKDAAAKDKYVSNLDGKLKTDSSILEGIRLYGLYRISVITGNHEAEDKFLAELKKILKDSFPIFAGIDDMKPEEVPEFIKSKFTYMYQ